MEAEILTLLDLNSRIKDVISGSFPETYWIMAEISEIRTNKSGHCYLELVEKDPHSDEIVARSRATVWSFTYRILKPYFETSTGRILEAGLKILVNVTVEFHEQYGLSLNIKDIDPVYTLGDLARKRFEIIARLEAEGVINMNRELDFPMVPQRIAVISSETAAGYDDFISHLNNNPDGYKFRLKLYQSSMQGQKAEESIIDALENIFDKLNDFDVVVIIRGGGSKAELSCFDNYRLAFHITQFPLPVLTGIGHERDESVVDIVAHAHLKTPTAVAEFLISRVSEFDLRIDDCSERLFSFISVSLNDESKKIENYSEKIIPLVKTVITAVKHDIEITKSDLTGSLQKFLSAQNRYIINYCSESKHAVTKNIIVGNQQIVVFARALLNDCHGLVLKKQHQMEMYHQAVNYVNPETILKRGYTITSLEGRIIKSVTALSAGEDVTTLFSDGSIESRINKVTSNK